MAISHLCTACGFDLAAVRAAREPRYRLWIVRCPTCDRVHARRADPNRALFKKLLRIDASLTRLAVQLAIAAGLTAGSILIGWLWLATPIASPHAEISIVKAGLIAHASLAIVTGAWIRATLSHLSWWQAWLGWLAWLLIVAGICVFSVGAAVNSEEMLPNEFRRMRVDMNSGLLWLIVYAVHAACATMTMMLSLAGYPIGSLMLRFATAFKSWRWRLRRRRRRREMSSA